MAASLQVSAEIARIVDKVRSGMVRISDGHRSIGAGCILHPEGLILTNAHVLQSPRMQIQVWEQRSFECRLIARDDDLDLAAIMIKADSLPVIPMADSSGASSGELVFSLGYPWGLNGGLTFGILIEGIDPKMPSEGSKLVASLHLRPGYSGGPMFNSKGEIIGLNTMMQGLDVGVAVPISRAKRFLKESIAPLNSD